MLKVGSRGSDVKALQKKLGITADGIFGPKTRAALITYQRSHGLADDGIAGPKTLGKLGLSGGGGGGSATKSKSGGSTPAASGPSLDAKELAARYGWSMAVLNSDPSLKKLFESAVKDGWAPDKFVAELRSTDWYKKHGEASRANIVLMQSDRATYNQRLNSLRQQIAMQAREIGAGEITGKALTGITQQAMMLGWNESQIRNRIAGWVQFTNGVLTGQAANTEREIRSYAAQMGLRVSDSFVVTAGRKVAENSASIDQYRQTLAKQAASAFPHLKDRLEAGETLAEIAAPYQQTMAQILEVNPEQIDLFDPTVRSALSGKDEKGKPSMKSLWQFEQDLKKDPRWLKTSNAQDSVMGTAKKVLSDFGLAV